MRRLALALPLLLAATSARALPEPSRGQLLYENHCQACHASTQHIRADRKARTAEDVERWVRHWSRVRNLGWSDEDILDVTDFLAKRYYAFPSRAPDLAPPPQGPHRIR